MNLLIPLTCQSCGGDMRFVERIDGTAGVVERAGLLCDSCDAPHVVTVTLRQGTRGRPWFPSHGDGR